MALRPGEKGQSRWKGVVFHYNKIDLVDIICSDYIELISLIRLYQLDIFSQITSSKEEIVSGGKTSIAKKVLKAIKKQLQQQRQALQVALIVLRMHRWNDGRMTLWFRNMMQIEKLMEWPYSMEWWTCRKWIGIWWNDGCDRERRSEGKASVSVQFYMVQFIAGSEEEERESGGASKPNGIETKVFS